MNVAPAETAEIPDIIEAGASAPFVGDVAFEQVAARAVPETAAPPAAAESTAVNVVLALSFAHLLNDVSQSLLPAIYPILKDSLKLDFAHIGLITLIFQLTSSLLQPLVGIFTDKKPQPYSLAVGMGATFVGLLLMSRADSLTDILIAASLVGFGSSVFHPEASRMAYMAAGGRHGFAQSLFQVGGNFGSSLGPLLAAWIVAPRGLGALAWLSLPALLGVGVLTRIGSWYKAKLQCLRAAGRPINGRRTTTLSNRTIAVSITILMALVISKFFYLVSFSNYYTFYLIDRFGVSIRASQTYLFVFWFAIAAGTIAGGPIGDRLGRKLVIWFSILGVAPFALVLPHVGLTMTVILSAIIGAIISSAFPAILVYAQELIPGKIGTVAGLFFGFAFGISGIASAALGKLADLTSIEYVFGICAYLPLIGLLAGFLPDVKKSPSKAS